MSSNGFQPKALSLDIETSKQNALKIWKLAAWRADTNEVVVSGTPADFAQLRPQLDRLADGARFVLGHNLRRHDLPALKALCPELALHGLKLVDTLELSPLAFPANPYHRLVKDYKLLAESRNDPLKDARQAFYLWVDQLSALQQQCADAPELIAAYHYLAGDDGVDEFFTLIRRSLKPGAAEVCQLLPPLLAGKVCPNALALLLRAIVADEQTRRAFAYVLAWLRVSGGNSVLPPWVRAQYPQVREQVALLRETPCSEPGCAYCNEHLDVRRELERHFGFNTFRPLPAAPDGSSLQEAIVRAGYAKQPILAILPTGGGKSICYQLPALSRYWRSGALTVVVSPLQSLMKDQVDNLVKAGILCAATLNGMLTMPERKDVLERIRLGGIGILLVSPEQFRNPAFTSAIRQREIAGWVFDEAHCLSRWGNDFRTDYLYVSRFIREHYPPPCAPVFAFTATAKADVIDDLLGHFKDALDMDLQVMDGGVERDNLHYEVIRVEQDGKRQEMLALLRHELGDGGGAVVFVSSRKHAEQHAEFLRAQGWACSAYHAGFDPALKKSIQQDFIAGDLRVIVATNAFGMGVDKQDIRLVIHADIPGSLENYLQEAGRAGRDRQVARCVLLYCREDVETQFGLALRSRLSRQDIAGILRLLKRHATRQGHAEMALTSGEILRREPEDEEPTGIAAGEPDTETRVRTALHWLESAGLIERNENRTQVFPASLKISSLDEGEAKLVTADLPPPVLERYRLVLAYLMNLDDDTGVSTDEMTQQLGLPLEQCLAALQGLEKLQLLNSEIAISCWLRKGVADASSERLQKLVRKELALITLLREQAPDAEGEWSQLSLRAVCEALRNELQIEVRPDEITQILHSLAKPLPRSDAEAGHEYLQVKVRHKEQLRVRLLKGWSTLQTLALRRQIIAQVLLVALEGKLPEGMRGASLQVASSLGELADALAGDLEASSSLGQSPERMLAAVNAGLLYLHDHGVLILDKGKALFRSAMTLKLLPESKGRGFREHDFMPLRAHYDERTLQIHVMHEYARLGLDKMADALAYILAYFSMPKMAFIRRYFAGRQEEISRAATHEAWLQIVGNLGDPDQTQLVTAKDDENLLVLAGPGAGKTRVIVHRVAFLIRLKGVSASAILVLAYNRAAAGEIRQRLRALLGPVASGVTVLTYHALALRLTGRSLAGAGQSESVFAEILAEATTLLTGSVATDGEDGEDKLREALLAGYRHILVDEYQDIDAAQYDLISALAGRTLERDAQLTLMAVGDDDQNIYAFRNTSNEYIRRFESDYAAQTRYLVRNYRSTARIIDAANLLIAGNPERLKRAHPIMIDRKRQTAAPGGRWETLDPLSKGRVLLLQAAQGPLRQAQAVVAELERRRALDPSLDWGDIAILARTHAQLEPFAAWCTAAGIPFSRRGSANQGQPGLWKTREGRAFLAALDGEQSVHLQPLAETWKARAAQDPDNPHWALCAAFCEEQCLHWGDETLAGSVLVEAFHEFARDARRDDSGRLVLSTVHQAKGGQWPCVILLDGGWQTAAPEERRLFYVAMTRAQDTLVICIQSNAHPFAAALQTAPEVLSLDARTQPPIPDKWRLRTLELAMTEIYLSFAGGQRQGSATHQALERLRTGDQLDLRHQDGSWVLYEPAGGITIGKLARRFTMPAGEVLSVHVHTLAWRTDTEGNLQGARSAVEGWWVALPRIVLRPPASNA